MNLDNTVFDKINHISAYWLGLYFSDGCICKTTRNRSVVTITSEDYDCLERLCGFYSANTELISSRKSKANDKTYNTLSFSNEYLYNRLNKLGCVPKKSLIVDKPNIPEKYYWSFLCGIFDGDGSISLNKRVNSWKVSIGTGSERFFDWLQTTLKNENIVFSTEHRKRKNNFYVICMNGINGKVFLDKCYKDLPPDLPLDRKKQKYEIIKNMRFKPPNFQDWELQILKENDFKTAKMMIEKDKRNIGWKRNLYALSKKKKYG